MDTKSQYVQWEVFNFFPRAIDNEFRCINPELRCIMPKVNTRRSMVSVGEEILHTYARAKSSQIGNTNFYYNREEGNFHPCQKGQYESSTLSNKNGSHKKPGII